MEQNEALNRSEAEANDIAAHVQAMLGVLVTVRLRNAAAPVEDRYYCPEMLIEGGSQVVEFITDPNTQQIGIRYRCRKCGEMHARPFASRPEFDNLKWELLNSPDAFCSVCTRS
jgi:hypothetical protein